MPMIKWLWASVQGEPRVHAAHQRLVDAVLAGGDPGVVRDRLGVTA
jgi:hypothetical protein